MEDFRRTFLRNFSSIVTYILTVLHSTVYNSKSITLYRKKNLPTEELPQVKIVTKPLVMFRTLQYTYNDLSKARSTIGKIQEKPNPD